MVEIDAVRTARLVVLGLDTTTGIPPQITEAAVIYLDGGQVAAGPFAYWVRPDAPMRQVRHRSWANVRPAPPWSEVAEQITTALADRTLVMHDPGRLHILRRHLPDWQPPDVVFTRDLAEQVWPGLGPDGYALGSVATHVQISLDPQVQPGAVIEAHAVALMLVELLKRGWTPPEPTPTPLPASRADHLS